MWSLRSFLILSLTAVLVSFFSCSYAAEEFSKQYKIEQLRNTAKMWKICTVGEVIAGGLCVYLGISLQEIGESGVTYYTLGALSLGGAYYTWKAAVSNEKEADRMEQELLKSGQGLLHLENRELALRIPHVEMYPYQNRVEARVSLLTCSF